MLKLPNPSQSSFAAALVFVSLRKNDMPANASTPKGTLI